MSNPNHRMTEEELAREASRWDSREMTPDDWENAPTAVPRSGETVPISLRMPQTMLRILKEFARREGVGYQVLMKRWLDDRIRSERVQMREAKQRRDQPDLVPIIQTRINTILLENLMRTLNIEIPSDFVDQVRERVVAELSEKYPELVP